jgi:hypothetical protein
MDKVKKDNHPTIMQKEKTLKVFPKIKVQPCKTNELFFEKINQCN